MYSVSGSERIRRIAFCVSARSGLGHLRRVTNIAVQLRNYAPDIDLCLVVNAPADGIAEDERALFTEIVRRDRRDMSRQLATMDLDAIVVDTAVLPDLELLPQPLILILRETVDTRLAEFRLPAGRLWDQVIIAEPATGWTVDPTDVGARSVRNTGWIYRSPSGTRNVLGRKKDARRLLVATGGGGDAHGSALSREIDAIVGELKRRCIVPLIIVQVLGPRAPKDARLTNADATIDVGPHLDEAFAEADAVISTSGYNSILELAAVTTPALLLAISRTYDDQDARARNWGPKLGLSHVRGKFEQSATWLAGILEQKRRRARSVTGSKGARTAASIIAGMARPHHAVCTRGRFAKRSSGVAATSARSVEQRSTLLFAQKVPTAPALMVASDLVTFARLEGPTAREIWVRRQACKPVHGLVHPVMQALAALHAAQPEGMALQPLDPLRRIAPRLREGTIVSATLGRRRVGDVLAFVVDLVAGCATADGAGQLHCIVHGDFHLGQLIAPVGRSGYIIIDHDDLALGQPESDIGNLIASIVTSPELNDGGIVAGFDELLHVMSTSYDSAAGRMVDPVFVRRYGAISLIRRALKQIERPAGVDNAELILAAAKQISGTRNQYEPTGHAMERTIRCA